ncbi:UNVERIFIED_CONTAM: hypothetical protein ABID98_004425 [Brevibacillus sp. OAP136]
MYTVFAMKVKMVKTPILLGDLLATGPVCPFFSMQISYREQVPVPFAF